MLEKAYIHNSQIILDEFFNYWQSEIKPISNTELYSLNDTLKAVYKLYEMVYDSVPKKNYYDLISKYKLLSDHIEYRFVDFFNDKFWRKDTTARRFLSAINPELISKYDTLSELYFEWKHDSIYYSDSILNFRPNILPEQNVVYVNKKYEMMLYYYFFGTDRVIYRLSEDSKRSTVDYCKRIAFLQEYVPVACNFNEEGGFTMGSAFSIMTKPKITDISFAYNFKAAQVYFILNGYACKAYFINDNGVWRYLNYKEYMCISG